MHTVNKNLKFTCYRSPFKVRYHLLPRFIHSSSPRLLITLQLLITEEALSSFFYIMQCSSTPSLTSPQKKDEEKDMERLFGEEIGPALILQIAWFPLFRCFHGNPAT